MIPAVIFDGKEFYRPGSYSKIDISKLNKGSPVSRALVMLGEADSGIPYNASAFTENERINYLTSVNQAKKVLKRGNLYNYVKFGFTPSKDPNISAPNYIIAIVVNQLTRSSKTLVKGVDDKIKLESYIYGKPANDIKVSISNGVASGKQLKVLDDEAELISPDVDRTVFKIIYTGAGTASTLTITNTKIQTTCTGATPDDLDITLADYSNLASLVNEILKTGVYDIELVEDGSYSKHTVLDNVSAVDILLDVGVLDFVDVHADFQAIIDWFDRTGKVVTSIVALATYEVPDNTAGYVFLSGATNTPATTTDWTDALAVAEKINASYIGIATGNPVTQALLSAHLNKMASITGKDERQGCIGATIDLTNSEKQLASKNLGNMLMGYAIDSIWRYDDNGFLLEYDPFYLSAMILGMSAGNDILFSPTFKQVNTEKLSVSHRDDADLFIKNGGIILEEAPLGGFRIVRAVTTHSGANDIANDWQGIGTALHVTKSHRRGMEILVGNVGTTKENVLRFATILLKEYQNLGWLQVDDILGNAFRSLTAEVVGGTFKLEYEGTIPVTTNFIFTTHHFTILGFEGI